MEGLLGMYQKARNDWTKHIDFMALDVICLQIAYCIAFFIRFPGNGFPYLHLQYRTLIIVMTLVEILSALIFNNHSNILRRGIGMEIWRVFLLSAVTLAMTSLYLFSAHTAVIYSRLLVYYTTVIFAVFDVAVRMAYKKILIRSLKNNANLNNRGRRLLIITDRDRAEEIVKEIRSDMLEPFCIQGLVLKDDARTQEAAGIPVVATMESAASYICREWIDEVLVYLPQSASVSKEFLKECAEMGITVHIAINSINVNNSKEFIEQIGRHTVLTTAYSYIEPYQAFIKRAMDIVGGLIGSVPTIVIGIFIGPIIYLNSPGPIIFKQKRVGKNGKQFNVLKFRSMYLDAEDRKKDLETENRVTDGRMFKMEFDPRVIGNRILPDGTKKTGIGEFIRRTSLDEFPQFFNILVGDMSLVGTRPPTLDEWEKYEYHHRARLSIKPGLTGLWQVSGRSEITDFEEVVKLDTKYILGFRLSLDLRILLKTIVVVFKRKGVY